MPSGFVPDRGDLIWINLNPQVGREQAGRRPAVILSPADYNRTVELAILCPITSRIKGYPFEVRIPAGEPVSGVVLADQIKILDWNARNSEYIGRLPDRIVDEILTKVRTLL